MPATLFPTIFLASGGIVFAFENSTLPGRIILLTLFFASIFSWSVMVTKFRVIRHAQRRREQFLELFRTDRQPLRIYTDRVRFEGAPVFAVYKAGCKELTFQLLGSAEVDETFRARLDIAPRISPAQMRVVTTAMERAVGETALQIESQMIILATAVAIPAMFGYNYLVTTIRGMIVELDNFAAELASEFEHKYVDHGERAKAWK
jgi:biopolymer transport protein ExbB/TolQ